MTSVKFTLLALLAVGLFLPLRGIEGATIGLWLLDEGKGEVAKDSSGMGNDGKITNANWVNGKFGSALQVDSTDSCVNMPYIPAYDVVDEFTLECWINPKNVTPGSQAIIVGRGQWANDLSGDYQLRINSNSTIRISCFGSSWTTVDGTALKVDTWYHVAGIKKGDDLELYVDGKLVNSKKMIGTPKVNANSFHVAQWGNGTDPAAGYHGIIDEIRLSDEALAPAELGFNRTIAKAAVSANGKLATVWGRIKQE
jgi:hypothetical protein